MVTGLFVLLVMLIVIGLIVALVKSIRGGDEKPPLPPIEEEPVEPQSDRDTRF